MADNRKTRRKKTISEKTDVANFKQLRLNSIKNSELYSDSVSLANSFTKSSAYGAKTYVSPAEVQRELTNALTNNEKAVAASKTLYATNPIYSRLIKYFSTLFLWRYVVTPQKLKVDPGVNPEKWQKAYMQMLDLADGLSLEIKMPKILTQLWIEGGVYFTSVFDENQMAVNIIVLPNKFTKRVGESIFGTALIKFDAQYFDSLGLSSEEQKLLFKQFPKEMEKGYNAYKKNSKQRWFLLDPRTSSCLLLNEKSVPTLLYSYGSILNYEKYQANELERSEAQLDSLVVHKLPTYQNELILEIPEMNALHKKLAPFVSSASRAKLMTTIGDVTVHHLQEKETRENTVLEKAFKSVFDNAGLNNAQFTGDSAEAITSSMQIDKNIVWSQVEEFMNFINLAINNLMKPIRGYQVEITMLRISHDTYSEDLRSYRDNASLGVGITSFIVASGIKQKNIESYLEMEENLDYVSRLKPLQSSHTTANTTEPGEGDSNNESSETNKEKVTEDEDSVTTEDNNNENGND